MKRVISNLSGVLLAGTMVLGCGSSGAPPAKAPGGASLQGGEGPSVGSRAPEIEGRDVDGVAFKLSDYRGKVVVLDFWGNW